MPLESWDCDSCGQLVTAAPNHGVVIWGVTDDGRSFDYRIVHKTMDEDPGSTRCDHGSAGGYPSSLDLRQFLGADGLTMLLSWLNAGPIRGDDSPPKPVSMGEYVHLVRRVQIPYYEEARQRFHDEETHRWLGDANEYLPYMPDTLKRISDGTRGR